MLREQVDYRDGATLYRSLGVRPLINANATLTVLGGSVMPPEVQAAMESAAQCFVDINELERAVGRRLAELTHNEAAIVTGGCAAGLTEIFAALMVGTDASLIPRLPDTTGLKNEVLIHRMHRNPYDQAVRTSGAFFRRVWSGKWHDAGGSRAGNHGQDRCRFLRRSELASP